MPIICQNTELLIKLGGQRTPWLSAVFTGAPVFFFLSKCVSVSKLRCGPVTRFDQPRVSRKDSATSRQVFKGQRTSNLVFCPQHRALLTETDT